MKNTALVDKERSLLVDDELVSGSSIRKKSEETMEVSQQRAEARVHEAPGKST